MAFKDRLCDWIDIVDRWQYVPTDSSQIEHWIEIAYDIADDFDFTELEMIAVDAIIDAWVETFRSSINEVIIPSVSKEHMDELCSREQVEQRTPAWYAQTAIVISASELGALFGSPRLRAQLVMSKITLGTLRTNILACPSKTMTPFDWGIRFEPVVKQIYCHRYNATIKELGRLTDLEDKRCTASPDGLVYDGPRAGRLIEIKCPVTREPDGIVPKDYYIQMQMQMRVSGCKACDYVEVQFNSPYSKELDRIGPGLYCGEIALVYNTETTEMRYEYGPVGGIVEPTFGKDEILLERIPWSVYSWSEQVVLASADWWAGVKRMIDAFWEDVEKAKRGEFIMPETRRRAPKAGGAAAGEACGIKLPDDFVEEG
jgi:hypothetical protein